MTLTVFTPTYNRAHLLGRVYESLLRQTCRDFVWLVVDDGSTDGTRALIEGYQVEGRLTIRYIHKENGGLYTGYNTAYANIDTELSVCVDSDDYVPDDAVEIIIDTWRHRPSDDYCGVLGLDFYADTDKPIGGYFPNGLKEVYFNELECKRLHRGDTKMAMRTDMMRNVSPMEGFPGEKNFNPVYMLQLACDKLPLLVVNKNLCYVEYQQTDSMSGGIFRQYVNSPRSFAKMRRMEMRLKHNNLPNRLRSVVHYVAECRLGGEPCVSTSPMPVATVILYPLGWLLEKYIRKRVKSEK